ncbi:uncharacterized protein METZ01_LOCUS415477 [marine metagenome]|uniref:Uncharacterized protein n=1 Tax=marine metagenome TaxID=408172 RepID=A0A382WVA0_9ZZZZ
MLLELTKTASLSTVRPDATSTSKASAESNTPGSVPAFPVAGLLTVLKVTAASWPGKMSPAPCRLSTCKSGTVILKFAVA